MCILWNFQFLHLKTTIHWKVVLMMTTKMALQSNSVHIPPQKSRKCCFLMVHCITVGKIEIRCTLIVFHIFMFFSKVALPKMQLQVGIF